LLLKADFKRGLDMQHDHERHSLCSPKHASRRDFHRLTVSLLSLSAGLGFFAVHTRQATAGPAVQKEWARCQYCNTMFFNGYPEKGRCPASDHGHRSVRGDFTNYHLVFDDSTGPGQGDWRFCSKCCALFFNGYAAKGNCAVDNGPHEAAGYNFFLYHDRPPMLDEEDRWRFCEKCFALFYNAVEAKETSVCPGGGRHKMAGFMFIVGRIKPTW
jgi:hypothetical protein